MPTRYTIKITGATDDIEGVRADIRALSVVLRERSPNKRAPRIEVLVQQQLDVGVSDAEAVDAASGFTDRVALAVQAAADRDAAVKAEEQRKADEKAVREAADQAKREADAAAAEVVKGE